MVFLKHIRDFLLRKLFAFIVIICKNDVRPKYVQKRKYQKFGRKSMICDPHQDSCKLAKAGHFRRS